MNKLYEKMIKAGVSNEKLEKFLRTSPMAWIHITFTGKYTFNSEGGEIDINQIVATLEKGLKAFGVKILKTSE